MAEAELVDTEVVRTSIGTWDTELDNMAEAEIACPAIEVEEDSEEDIEMILTSIGNDVFELCDTDLDGGYTSKGQTKFEEDKGTKGPRDKGIVPGEFQDMVPGGFREFQCDSEHLEKTCESDCIQIELQSNEHVTEL